MSRARRVSRILTAQKEPLVRAGLRFLLNRQQDMKVVAEAGSGEQAVRKFLQYRPDLALVEMDLPGMGGLEVLRSVRRKIPSARVIILTDREGDEDVYRAIRAGAQAYVFKDANEDEVLETIRAVRQGMAKIAPRVASKLAARVQRSALTERELQVLRQVVGGSSNKEIGSSLKIKEGTVKIHVNHIMKKLGVRGRTEAVTTALKRGLVHLPEV
jgi:DNA-binding NarL/FixJ family response regulator